MLLKSNNQCCCVWGDEENVEYNDGIKRRGRVGMTNLFFAFFPLELNCPVLEKKLVTRICSSPNIMF